ncbi:MAG: OsmC family protein [Fibrobacterota bacterium]
MSNATVEWIQDMKFKGTTGSGHSLIMDAGTEHGGANSGPRPGELPLVAFGGCTGMDVIGILKKMHIVPKSFRTEIRGENATDHPKVYTEIWIKYIVEGDVPEDKLAKAIDLSFNTYCSVGALLKKSATVHHSYEILPAPAVN